MNDRSLAIGILHSAREQLGRRLTERIIEAREEIEADACGQSYLSEIEAIYDQLGSRLAHVSAMLANLPPAADEVPSDATATEIIYADLASGSSTAFEPATVSPPTVLALPAPPHEEAVEADSLADTVGQIVVLVAAGDHFSAARLISECFDSRPSQARHWSATLGRQMARRPDLARRLIDLAASLDETDEHTAVAVVGECFELEAFEAVLLLRVLKRRANGSSQAD
jgi:hypothetical protein